MYLKYKIYKQHEMLRVNFKFWNF